MDELDAISIDVGYALTQLRKFGDVRRAIDALERIEANLAAMREDAAGFTPTEADLADLRAACEAGGRPLSEEEAPY